MDVVSPNNFCVVKDSLTPQLQTLKDEMNLVRLQELIGFDFK